MAGRVLVFEPRASVLGRISSMLRATGTDTTDCYSEAKFRHTVKTSADRAPLIVCSARFVSVAREASPGGCVIPYASDYACEQPDDLASRKLVRELQNASRRRTRRHGGAKPLDLLVIGASTGGFPVVQEVLRGVKPTQSIVVIAQHISPGMTEELSRIACDATSVTTVHGRTRLKAGGVYMLAGGKDFEFVTQGAGALLLKEAVDAGSHYHPSVSALLRSLARLDVERAAAVVLSGLGGDGADGFPGLRDAGVETLVQDPASAKAPGMPSAAIATGAVTHVYPVDQLHAYVKRRIK